VVRVGGSNSGFRVWGLGFRLQCLVFKVEGFEAMHAQGPLLSSLEWQRL